jgi:hypothetical protein
MIEITIVKWLKYFPVPTVSQMEKKIYIGAIISGYMAFVNSVHSTTATL